jgi:uncharacterized protein YeaO (DUF488 family)
VSAVRLKRIYDDPAPEDGTRVLVDRLWPRGVSREVAAIDFWARDLAPSDELRRSFSHDPERFDEFRRRYLDELRGHGEELEELAARGADGTLTLLFAARDTERNNAVVLAEALAAYRGLQR